MTAPLVWVVIWVDEHGQGHGTCGHSHPTDVDAMACPWEPENAPLVSSGLVRQVRDPAYVTIGQELMRERRATRQLELAL